MNAKGLRRYLLTGLVVWLPLLITVGVLRFIIDLLDNLVPQAYQPEQLLGHHIPGVGVIISLALLLLTGMFATNYLGQRFVAWGDAALSKIPLVRSIYNTVKQVIDALFATNSEAFRKVVLIEYPRKGSWSMAFQTGGATSEMNQKANEDMISVFIPTTPNPTSGFLLMVPKKDAVELDMSIDAALKYIISLGVMQSTKATATLAEPNLNKI